MKSILYILPTFNVYGGTPKKTLDLIKYSDNDCSLYVYENGYGEFKYLFEDAGASIYEGYYKRNIFLHLKAILNIIAEKNVQIIQTQFAMGEILGFLIKIFRPHVKLLVAFVGPFEPTGIKKVIAQRIYSRADAFVYISEYVKREKIRQFSILETKKSSTIFNGTEKLLPTCEDFSALDHPSLYSTSGLVDWKNIDVLVEAMHILNEQGTEPVFLYIAGDGPERASLEDKITRYKLERRVFLLGYQKNIGALLEETDIYVHPAYAEGFGIAVAEAMMAGKPIIVADAGALPELVENKKSGFVVNPVDANAWAEAILKLIENESLATTFGENAKSRAQNEFSIARYVSNYQSLYDSLTKTCVG